MCGIAGRYSPDGLIENAEWAPGVSQLLKHRGPDGDGFFNDPYCQLVHRRLALIDLTSTGHQPMTNEDQSIWIVFNGEIYGYNALRTELIQKGHTFRGTSDTEVLLHLYEECGPDMLSRLRGIFAFAIYDQNKKSLLLVRDRFGTKPLYYTYQDGQWIFASELKAILSWPGLSARLDRQAVYDFLSWGYIPEPATGFQKILALPKGCYLHVLPGRSPTIQQYYQPEPSPLFQGGLNKAVESVANRLEEAIRYQQVADVPVGSLLSGGIDSGLVTAAYSKVTNHDFYTFTVGFPDADYDETSLAATSARYLRTRHTLISTQNWRLDADQAVELLAHFDQPFSDTSLFAVNLVARGIRESGLRCAFSGDGGDEAFGGYDFYRHLTRLQTIQRLPGLAKTAALTASQAFLGSRSPVQARQIRKAVNIAQNTDSSAFLTQLISYVTEPQKEALVRREAREGLLPIRRLYKPFEQGWGLENLSSQLTTGMFDYLLPSDMLKKVDMMSMKNSVEIRVPMLDESLVDFALHLPHALKANTNQSKIVLRELASRWLPAEITQAKKHGFGIPLDVLAAQSLKGAIREWLLDTGARTRSIFDRASVEHWVDLFEHGSQNSYALEISREGLYQRLFFLLSLEIWMQKYSLTW